jgi:hypothetical protein
MVVSTVYKRLKTIYNGNGWSLSRDTVELLARKMNLW